MPLTGKQRGGHVTCLSSVESKHMHIFSASLVSSAPSHVAQSSQARDVEKTKKPFVEMRLILASQNISIVTP